jgi:hypothetical protein
VAALLAIAIAGSLLPPAPAGAQREDPALAIARTITRRVATFENLRVLHPFGTWAHDDRGVWSIRRSTDCLAELQQRRIPHRAWRPMPDPVPTPVRITGPIGGVVFRKTRAGAPLFLSCEMATRLPDIAAIVRDHGVTHVDILSAYRREPPQSFHIMGLALDISVLHRRNDVLDLERDWEVVETGHTCENRPPRDPRGRALFEIACALADTHRFSSVITPNYDEGHYNHFHIDARPDDARFFVR